MGRDLSAQMAHAELAQSTLAGCAGPPLVWRFRPAGLQRLVSSGDGASGRTPYDGACLCRVRVLFAALLKRTAVARPVAGAITGAVCLTGNLVVTRTTFELGLALALGALLVLASGRLRVRPVLSVLATLCSPVAGLFLGVAGGALFLTVDDGRA